MDEKQDVKVGAQSSQRDLARWWKAEFRRLCGANADCLSKDSKTLVKQTR